MVARKDRQTKSGMAGNRQQAALTLRCDRPVDLVHLARQTFGDAALEREILVMFDRQLADAVERLPRSGMDERRRLAHGLVGSARGVGAFRLADCAADIETMPAEEAHIGRFNALADEVRSFIAGPLG